MPSVLVRRLLLWLRRDRLTASMGSKEGKIETLLAELGVEGEGARRRYLGYFACFNRQLFYEAHEVLEEIWLPLRRAPDGNFYKGLIQLAGAFVHLQKGKIDPAARLLRMAQCNLIGYPAVHHELEIGVVVRLIEGWLHRLEEAKPYRVGDAPRLNLLSHKGQDFSP